MSFFYILLLKFVNLIIYNHMFSSRIFRRLMCHIGVFRCLFISLLIYIILIKTIGMFFFLCKPKLRVVYFYKLSHLLLFLQLVYIPIQLFVYARQTFDNENKFILWLFFSCILLLFAFYFFIRNLNKFSLISNRWPSQYFVYVYFQMVMHL